MLGGRLGGGSGGIVEGRWGRGGRGALFSFFLGGVNWVRFAFGHRGGVHLARFGRYVISWLIFSTSY